LLGVLESVSQSHPLSALRWSIAHLNDASTESLERMRQLGLGWLVQNALYFRGEELIHRHGRAAEDWPRVSEALSLGVPVGMGTDAHRVMNYNPFVALQWLVDGRTAGGMITRAPHKTLSRMQALKLYTQDSAWFAHAESRRGTLEPGYLADLVVLDQDYLKVPVARISSIRSLLTMVGGRVVYADGVFRSLQ
jgi:predicted amidohydrolase YtcJ